MYKHKRTLRPPLTYDKILKEEVESGRAFETVYETVVEDGDRMTRWLA